MREKEYDKTLDVILDEIMDKAAAEVSRQDGEKLKDQESVEFSEEHEKKMKVFFTREKRKRFAAKLTAYTRRAACILLLIAVICGASVFGVEAWRSRFLHFFYDPDAPNMNFSANDDIGTHYSDESVALNYIPFGFELTQRNETTLDITLVFQRNDGRDFCVHIANSDMNYNVNTENSEVEDIQIGGLDGICITRPNYVMIVWADDECVYTVDGTLTKSEMKKICENLKRFKSYPKI